MPGGRKFKGKGKYRQDFDFSAVKVEYSSCGVCHPCLQIIYSRTFEMNGAALIAQLSVDVDRPILKTIGIVNIPYRRQPLHIGKSSIHRHHIISVDGGRQIECHAGNRINLDGFAVLKSPPGLIGHGCGHGIAAFF
ncbi:hypothetical protein SDC9_142090 [bioreactor metagenome]|uniref:Uncharacterized protein n=1 Tax=bioreactor metagenome TaxID=1076179 RepID=A0A645E061_9ZZZZ